MKHLLIQRCMPQKVNHLERSKQGHQRFPLAHGRLDGGVAVRQRCQQVEQAAQQALQALGRGQIPGARVARCCGRTSSGAIIRCPPSRACDMTLP